MKAQEKPKISVIMSAYNSENFIAEAMDSILNQTFKDFELIIVNDASTDNTWNIIKKYQRKDKRIKVLSNKKNLYATISRNKAIKISNGKYIAIQDADDFSLPERLQIQHDYLESHQDIFLLGTGAVIINKKGDKIKTFKPITNLVKLKKCLEKTNCIYQPTIMFRNEGGLLYREKMYYSEDYDFYLVLLSKEKVLNNIKDKLVKYRILRNSVSHSKTTKQYLFAEKAKEFYFQRLKYGKDEYNQFNPKEILNMDPMKINNRKVLELEIKVSLKTKNRINAKRLTKEYFKKYGYFNKVILYWIKY